MSSIKIGLAVIGSLLTFTASASAEVRYNGFPKLGYSVVSPASAPANSIAAGKSSVFDARAELPRTEIPARQSPFSKGGINSRGI
jgi:hypothetical protein